MLHELDCGQFHRVGDLFRGLHYHLAISSVVTGQSDGRVVVDDVGNPATGLVWDQVEGGYYLAGEFCNHDFNLALNRWILETGFAAARATGRHADLHLYVDRPGWEPEMDVVLAGVHPLRHTRKHFIYDTPRAPRWRSRLPAGFVMASVDAALLARNHLRNFDRITGWIDNNWRSATDFLARGAGCCLLAGDEIVSWSLADFAAGDEIEIGIATAEGYRQRGFATLTTEATVEACLMKGYRRVGWHCWSSNQASAATAVRAGFRQTCEHPVYHAWYNGCDNRLVRGSFLFERSQHRAAVSEFELAAALIMSRHPSLADSRWAGDDNVMRWYYDRAIRAALLAGQPEAALRFAGLAMNRGWNGGHLARLADDEGLAGIVEGADWSFFNEGAGEMLAAREA